MEEERKGCCGTVAMLRIVGHSQWAWSANLWDVNLELRNCYGCLLLCCLVFLKHPAVAASIHFVFPSGSCTESIWVFWAAPKTVQGKSLGLRGAFSWPAVACIFSCKYCYICCNPALQQSVVAVMQAERVCSFWYVLILGSIALGGNLGLSFWLYMSLFCSNWWSPPFFFFLLLWAKNIRCL